MSRPLFLFLSLTLFASDSLCTLPLTRYHTQPRRFKALLYQLLPTFYGSCMLTGVANSRPGILVLINDADWELEGEEAYEIQSGDNILFVSTLHGG
jgi:hypothetical protein